MDYTENSRKTRKELFECQISYAEAPVHKILTHKNALDDFVSKEYAKFCADVIGTVPFETVSDEKEEFKKAKQRLKLRASTDIN